MAGLNAIPRFYDARKDQHLSQRETEVCQSVCRGLGNKEIGAFLGITEKTVKNHLQRVFQKFHVSNRTELAGVCFRKGLVQ